MVAAVTESPWTAADQLLMLARAAHLAEFCPGCGQPKVQAWHPDNDGWYEARVVVCNGCATLEAASNGDLPAGARLRLIHTRDYEAKPLPELAEELMSLPVTSGHAHPPAPTGETSLVG